MTGGAFAREPDLERQGHAAIPPQVCEPAGPRSRLATPSISSARRLRLGRTLALLVRKLKGLDDAISVSVVEPGLTDQGWRFGDYPGANRDALNKNEVGGVVAAFKALDRPAPAVVYGQTVETKAGGTGQ